MQIVKVDGYSIIVPKIDFLTGIYSTKKTSQMRDPTFQHKVSVSSSVGYIVYTVVDIFTCIWYIFGIYTYCQQMKSLFFI